MAATTYGQTPTPTATPAVSSLIFQGTPNDDAWLQSHAINQDGAAAPSAADELDAIREHVQQIEYLAYWSLGIAYFFLTKIGFEFFAGRRK